MVHATPRPHQKYRLLNLGLPLPPPPPPPAFSPRRRRCSQKIHDAYAGDKNIVLVEGDHNSPRPNFLFDSVYIFLQNYLQVPLDWGLDRGNTLMGYPPWHQGSGGGGNAAAMLRAAAARHASFDPELTDFVDWDGIGVDDIGVDGAQGVGVTSARQADFQTALFHMLAQVVREGVCVYVYTAFLF